MSLNVYLAVENPIYKVCGSGIFVRENGENKELTMAEAKERYPDYQFESSDVETLDLDNEVFSGNITHNLGEMAESVGIYYALWRPEEIGVVTAEQLIPLLTEGLRVLRENPQSFERYAPENGWGTYTGLCNFVEKYLDACRVHPDAVVRVSR